MQLPILSTRNTLLVGLVCLIAAGGLALGFAHQQRLQSETSAGGMQEQTGIVPLAATLTAKTKGASKPPARLKIPAIGVNAPIEEVGLAPDGSVGVPAGPSDAAWFDRGPHPGDTGSAVIVGHFGWKYGIPAVFDNLSKLKAGDKVYVQDANGTTHAFVVREVRTYSDTENPVAVFSAGDAAAHLNLITCSGVWNKGLQSYSNRVVVFTDKQLQ